MSSNSSGIIDWIKMDGEAYMIRALISKLLSPLDKGVLVLLSQKRSYKAWGEGGEGGMDLISAGFLLMYQRLLVHKVKSHPDDFDPNGKMFGFEIYNGGSKFANIREITKCTACKGNGDVKGEICGACNGTKWVNK